MSEMGAVPPIEQVNVLGIGIDAVDMERTAFILGQHIRRREKGYVCLTGVHGVMEAQRDPSLKSVFARALLVAPDGMPTVWIGHRQGFSAMQRVFGPDLMAEI